ncbi:hydrogenase maturation protease [Actinophytocola oryzae]|uniref:Hydrogenase maturation protease n=1 Tax=Actinophytocola oryzae TaxID=502181 RepID=A0A4R7V7K4_9PSEU|nr:hydrogenase maturation protease [Actinophytocola oryzae]TDV44135.1 hydrogenase maturation protease [Actinophytocola oryzae]
MTAVVIGVGNEYRRDDGIGPAVAERLRRHVPPGVEVVTTDGEPARVLDAWTGRHTAVVVDAVVCTGSTPGRVHRLAVDEIPRGTKENSSHGLGIPEAVELARALDRLPVHLVLYTVEVTDTGYGTGLSPPVASAIPDIVAAVLAELTPGDRTTSGGDVATSSSGSPSGPPSPPCQ